MGGGRAARLIAAWVPGVEVMHYFEGVLGRRAGFFYVGLLRCFPVIRSIISLPAGMLRMDILRFAAFTTVGCSVWATAWVSIGVGVGESWRSWSRPVTIVLLTILGALLWAAKRAVRRHVDAHGQAGDVA